MKAAAQNGLNDAEILTDVINRLQDGFVDTKTIEVSNFGK